MRPSAPSGPDVVGRDGHAPVTDAAAGTAPDSVDGWTDEIATNGTEERERPVSLGDRFRRPQTLISFAIALAIIWFFFQRLDLDVHAVWQNVKQTNLLLYGLAFVAFYSGFFFRAHRWRQMLHRVEIDRAHGHDVPGDAGLIEIYLLSWFANCVVPAKLGDAYRSYLLKQRARASFSTTFGTIIAERLTDLTVLFATMSAMALVVFGRHLPSKVTDTFIGGLALLAVAAVGLGVMWWTRDRLLRRLPERLREQYGRLHDAVFACLRRPERFIAVSGIVWLLEGLRLFLVTRALGAHVTFTTALFVALMASLVTTLPITPAGLGVVEPAMILVLKWKGVDANMAGAIALLDRVIGYWSVIAVGFVVYAHQMLPRRGASAWSANRASSLVAARQTGPDDAGPG